MFKRTIILMIVFYLLIGIEDNSVFAQTIRITKAGYPASTSEIFIDKAAEYVAANDLAALQTLIDKNLIFPLKGGLKVYVVDTKLFSGKIKIRPVGKTIEFWTLFEAVSSQ
jgi:hypothetical protein